MKKFYISVTEILNKVVAVEANNREEALEKVENACNNNIVELDLEEDFVDRTLEDETEQTEMDIQDIKKENPEYNPKYQEVK